MSDRQSYLDLIQAKAGVRFEARGLARVPDLHAALFPHQRAVVEFLLRAGCGAAFLDTGLGKTFVALEWGRVIMEACNKPVLMLAPLAVGAQHAREAALRGIDAVHVREMPADRRPRIVIANYERLERLDLDAFGGVILDESSILKSFSGKTTNALIEAFQRTPYRLAATATPAPNDHTELGQHAAFLGVMRSNEMLSRWFITDQSRMGAYRLKRYAFVAYWDWVASWARCVARPSDLGFDDRGFALPELIEHRHVVAADRTIAAGAEKSGQMRMFRMPEMSATSVHREKRMTIDARADAIAAAVTAEASEPWVIWVETNAEADAMMARLPAAIEVRGNMKPEMKEDRFDAFARGSARWLVTKASIAGFGLNWQHCARMAYVGRSFSYESYYQSVRRCWRFGQTRPVHVHVAMADTEQSIADVLDRKTDDHGEMKLQMAAAMARATNRVPAAVAYRPTRRVDVPQWMRSVA